jgi:hydroxyethylthiazole kinase-like uncharacterized protein yjeF
MPQRLLSPDEMGAADRMAAELGPFDLWQLMENAGAAVAREALRRFPEAERVAVLCGPGNNGGDGYVAARIMAGSGVAVTLWQAGRPRAGGEAARAAEGWRGEMNPLADFRPEPGMLVVDALFGAGLSKPLDGEPAKAAEACNAAGARVLAVDLPSGVSGADGTTPGPAFRAEATVTFMCSKPGHLLLPGRELCGEVVVADIGIPEAAIAATGCRTWANGPGLWRELLPRPAIATHKYARGHAAVFSGGPSATGAARLAAMAAARAGAGAVTVLSPAHAMLANAAHLTSMMLARIDGVDEMHDFIRGRAPRALVLGPGFGVTDKIRSFVLSLLGDTEGEAAEHALVLDADAITAFRDQPETLFAACRTSPARVVLTPHEGEFRRLFPDLADVPSKLERARQAAARSNAVVALKGPDTVIAAPDGRAAINANGTPLLATAGSGDVLAGLIAGLAAQGMPAWEASCAAVWLHAEAARDFGPGLIAEDLPDALPGVLRRLV